MRLTFKFRDMKKTVLSPTLLFMFVCALFLSGCMSGDSKLFWSMDDKGKQPREAVEADARPVLDVPPSLRGEVSVPEADEVAIQKAMPERYKKIVAGKRVALDAKVYDKPAASVFSAVVDAMTGLNMPVQSVDSASGTVTTDWIRTDAGNASVTGILNMMGGGGPIAIRYRFVVRVLRQESTEEGKELVRLEVRTTGQSFSGRHWVNKKMSRKYSNDLFSRVEEVLAK